MEKVILFTNVQKNKETYFFNEWFEFNGKKFCYHIEICNGWNYANQSIKIMKPDGTWELIATSYAIGCLEPNSYLSPEKWDEISQRLVTNFDNWLSKVYGK